MGRLARASSPEETGPALDYSRAPADWPSPHDLVYLDVAALPADVPGWARAVIAAGAPAVVRRAPRSNDRVPIGIRGASKAERCAVFVSGGHIVARCAPEMIDLAVIASAGFAERRAHVPAFAALSALVPEFTATGLAWGVTGALAYERVTGQRVAHPESDIDLLVRMPAHDADRLAVLGRRVDSACARFGVHCDIQLETPAGGVALADWRSGAREVMVKSDTGPYLSRDPWQIAP